MFSPLVVAGSQCHSLCVYILLLPFDVFFHSRLSSFLVVSTSITVVLFYSALFCKSVFLCFFTLTVNFCLSTSKLPLVCHILHIFCWCSIFSGWLAKQQPTVTSHEYFLRVTFQVVSPPSRCTWFVTHSLWDKVSLALLEKPFTSLWFLFLWQFIINF